jgi:hypothetical protein
VNHCHFLRSDQVRVGGRIGSVAAQHLMPAERPDVARSADRRSGKAGQRLFVGGGLDVERQRSDHQIDLRGVEAGGLDIEGEIDDRQVLQLFGQKAIVPGADFGQSVVGDHEGPALGLGQVIETDCRNFGPAELLGRQQAAMTGHHVAGAVDEDRDIEAKALDALSDLSDLLLAVNAGVS